MGFNTPLGIADFPLNRVSFCQTDSPSYDYTGSWYQACHTDSLSDFDTISIIEIQTGGDYVFNRYLYGAGTGCPDNVTEIEITVEEDGSVCLMVGGITLIPHLV